MPGNDTPKIAISISEGTENPVVSGPSLQKQLYPEQKCSFERRPVVLKARTASPDREHHSGSIPCTGYESSHTYPEQTCEEVSNSHCTSDGEQRKASFLQHAMELSRKPAFYALVLAIIIADYSESAFQATIVDYGRDKGIGFGKASKLATISSLGQSLGSTLLPMLADAVPRSRSPLYVTSFALTSACLIIMPQVVDISCVAVLTAVIGLAAGYFRCAKYVVIAEHVGIERTAVCFGMIGLGIIPLGLANASII
ncbi:hypothetical protein V5799_022063, partial [Amblyomma americanum]